MKSYGNKKVYYLESTEGGHAGSTTNEQKAYWQSVMMEFFRQELML